MMPAPLRPFLRSSISQLHLTGIQRAGSAMEEGAVQLGARICWAAGLGEFEHIEIANVTRGSRFGGHVRFGRERELVVVQSPGRIVQRGDVLRISAYAWLPEGELGRHVTHLVTVDATNALIEFRQVAARGVSLDPASYPLPPAIELVGGLR